MGVFKAAIIDDGAAAHLFENVRCVTVDGNLQIYENENFTTEHNHSSTCIKIIKKYTDISNIDWIDINIINTEYTGNICNFLKALEYCRKNGVKLIHLSIGSRDFRDFERIKKETELLLKKNTIMVAALSNEDEYTSPACLEGVIGVKCSASLKDNELFYLEDNPEKINFLASSKHLLRRDGVLNYSSLSNSYATPVVTAAAIDALKENPTMNVYEVIEKIKSRSKEFLIYKAPQIFEKGTEDMLETPVVMVRLKDISVQDELVRSLKEQFIKKGYNAFCSYSFSKDKNRLPSDRLINYLLYIQKFYRSDIIILSYTDQKPYSDFHSYDVVISDYSMNNFDFMYHAGKLIEFSDLNNSITVINKILNEFEEGAM